MINVGVIGLGMMGGTHLDAYASLADKARVVAVADRDPDKLAGRARAAGNIEGQAQGALDLAADPMAFELGQDLVHAGGGEIHLVERLHRSKPRRAALVGLARVLVARLRVARHQRTIRARLSRAR